MESQTDYSRIDKSIHIHWALSALLSTLLYFSGCFLLKELNQSVSVKRLFVSFGYLICMILALLYHFISLRIRNGHCPNLQPESVYIASKGIVPGFTLGIVAGVFMFLSEFCYLQVWSLDPTGAGIVFFLLMGVVPICSFMSYFFFNEKFRLMQVVGILISLSGISFVGIFEISTNETYTLSFCFGIGSVLFFSFRNIAAKFIESKKVDVYTSGMLNCLGEVLAGICLGVYLVSFSSDLGDLLVKESLILTGASVLIAFGQYYFNQSIMTGNIGVVITLFNMNGIGFIFTDYLLNDYYPRVYTLLLFLIVIVGIALMIFGDTLLDKCKKQNRTTIIQVF